MKDVVKYALAFIAVTGGLAGACAAYFLIIYSFVWGIKEYGLWAFPVGVVLWSLLFGAVASLFLRVGPRRRR